MGEHMPMIDMEVEAFNRSQTEKIISIKKERLKRESAKEAARRQIRSFFVSLAIVLFFALVFGTIIYRNSMVNEAKYDIFNLKTEIKSLNAQIEELNADIENQTELSYIEKVAKESLNMQYPTKSQIVYIDGSVKFALSDTDAQIASETVQSSGSDNPEASGGDGEGSRVIDFISALFKLK
jgi:cell division protein FtsL